MKGAAGKIVRWIDGGRRVELLSPTAMPQASAFLWNSKMLVHVNCRGYATAQFMQPEPAKYAHAPNLEAKTFMQPEQPYYAHHPGRFFYVKDEQAGSVFSAPYEPVRAKLDHYVFSVGQADVAWEVEKEGIELRLRLSLAPEAAVELWEAEIHNTSGRDRKVSLYPYFPVGYMSWMNQSARYDAALNGIVASSVTPYQKVADYFKNKDFKDQTFLVSDVPPSAWDARQEGFEGEGGLQHPTGVQQELLSKSEAVYEMPTAALQFRLRLKPGERREFRFLFGPAKDEAEIAALRGKLLSNEGFTAAFRQYSSRIAEGEGCLRVETPDTEFDAFVNYWLPRQVFYHGSVNRLTTDPQTRNYLQDNMGMSYLRPAVARAAFLHALSQQEASGAMPDGILLFEGAELKYINQVPHTDHCVWLPVCLQAYLEETNDYAILDEAVSDRKGELQTAFERITRAMRWLVQARDERGLSYIAQGDWCDPMNMVGYKGKGVSGWLSLATAYALRLWAEVCERRAAGELAQEFRACSDQINGAVNRHLWDGNWFGRGITDDGVVFGTSKDAEGKIFLNCQGWSILSGAADKEKRSRIRKAVEEQLETPYGVMTLAPAFTRMREDVGRVTQKFPGSAENGSVYNHDAAFYVYALYFMGEGDRAFGLVRQMIAGPEESDYLQRGQLPVFIPNYYRGAWRENPRTAGRSSQLFNTGTVSWVYRCLLEGLFGLKGDEEGMRIEPHLPSEWQYAKATRKFRGATFEVEYRRVEGISGIRVQVDGKAVARGKIEKIQAGKCYQVAVSIDAKRNQNADSKE